MNKELLLKTIKQGETSRVQFKERLTNKESIADEMIVPNTSVEDIDTDKVKSYLEKIDDSENDLSKSTLYKNLNIINGGRLTLGGLLFFAKKPQKYRPAFCIKAVSFLEQTFLV